MVLNAYNGLTGRSRQSHLQCPVSANAISSQLTRNGKYEDADKEISQLVMRELSDLRRVTVPYADFCPKIICYFPPPLKTRYRIGDTIVIKLQLLQMATEILKAIPMPRFLILCTEIEELRKLRVAFVEEMLRNSDAEKLCKSYL